MSRFCRRWAWQVPHGREWASGPRKNRGVRRCGTLSRWGLGGLDLIVLPPSCLVPPALIIRRRRPDGRLRGRLPLRWSRHYLLQRFLPRLRIWQSLDCRLVQRLVRRLRRLVRRLVRTLLRRLVRRLGRLVGMENRAVRQRSGSRHRGRRGRSGREMRVRRYLPRALNRLWGPPASTACRRRVVRRGRARWGGRWRNITIRPRLDVYQIRCRRRERLLVWGWQESTRGHVAGRRNGPPFRRVVGEIAQ